MKSYGKHAKEFIAANWRTWFNDKKYDLGYQDSILKVLWEQMEKLKGAEFQKYADIYEEMLEEYHENERLALKVLESECPIGFFQPSWEQAQVLNAWHPEFDPGNAPVGYRSVCLFCGNQIGKTCVSVINTALWFTPNNPEWAIFREYEDTSSKKRGKYQVKIRPDWALWNRTGKMVCRPEEPPMAACECWHGVENDDAWKNKVGEEYKKWLPKDWYGRRSDGGTAIFVQERRIESRYGHKITGKTFNSDIQDWAGKPDLRIINIDEGIPPHLLREALLRIGGNGYFMWPYTPVEARNIGQRAKCAWDVYQGNLKLVGQTKFFLDFSMIDAPDFVMNQEKKADNLARLTGDNGEDKIRREGGFFNSSPVVFGNYSRPRNVLPLDGSQVLAAIQGKTVTEWIEPFGKLRADMFQDAFLKANIIRGMDEGLANPTACVWIAILRTGEYVAFKEWEQSGLSVSERCMEIVERSRNKLKCFNPEAASERKRYVEETPPEGMKVKRTFADSKMFRRNPETPQDDWTETYRKAGVRLERATNIGPAARCDFVNDLLRGEANRKHLMGGEQPGPRMYLTRDCTKLIERCENYLWSQIQSGSRMGEFTDKPEVKDDHTVDAWCYAACSKLRWHDAESMASGGGVRYDPLTGAVIR
jgi:hypothetical protein